MNNNVRCKPCEGGVTPLQREEAEALMSNLSSSWVLSESAAEISAEWKFDNFLQAMSFANAVAHIANTENHHPDLEVGYGYCRVRFTTTAIDGLSENDFVCAVKIDALNFL